jgi:hypothetical protein
MMNFPKAEAVVEITELAARFRAAAAELDNLAAGAPSIEIGTLRRQANAVRIDVAHALVEGEVTDG